MAIDQETWDRFKRKDREGELIERELAVHWDDLRFPAVAINPPGAASDPDVDPTDGTLLFAAGSTEVVFFAVQLPHCWKMGSAISPHVHWVKTTSAAGTVKWTLSYRWADLGETLSAWSDADAAKIARVGGDDTYGADAKLLEFDIHYQIDSRGSDTEYVKWA